MKQLSDISLVTRVAVFHDKKAFDALVVKYQSAVRRFFLSQTLGDEQLSDDLAQDTFIKAYTSIGRFRGLSGFSTWLYRIAYNVLYDYRRSHKITDDVDSLATERSAAQTDKALGMDIYGALKILKADERLCLTLQIVDGLPVDKISEITSLPVGTVKSHLSRSKHKLANYLKDNGYER